MDSKRTWQQKGDLLGVCNKELVQGPIDTLIKRLEYKVQGGNGQANAVIKVAVCRGGISELANCRDTWDSSGFFTSHFAFASVGRHLPKNCCDFGSTFTKPGVDPINAK